MKFRVKLPVAVLAILAVTMLHIPVLSAQQQTGNVAPETRNPQSNPVELHEQQGDLQDTSPQQLLNETSGDIQIPAGRPAAPANDEVVGQQSLWSAYWYIILLGLLPAIFYVLSMKPDKDAPFSNVGSSVDLLTDKDISPQPKTKKHSGKKKQPRSKRKK